MVLLLMVVILFGAFSSVVKAEAAEEKIEAALAEGSLQGPWRLGGRSTKMNKWAAGFASGIVVILALALWQSRNFNISAGLFPWVSASPSRACHRPGRSSEFTGKAGGRPFGAAGRR